MRFSPVLLACLAGLALACSGDNEPTGTPEASPSPAVSASPPPTVTFTRPPSPTPESQRVASTVWLMAVDGDEPITLYEDYEDSAAFARFDESDSVLVGVVEAETYETSSIRYGLDGREIAREAWSWPADETGCRQDGNDAEIAGRRYAGVECGQISPDGRWMTYRVDAGEMESSPGSGYIVPVWDQWAVNLETDERRELQAGLLHCGGCDSRFSPAWSTSSRYLYFSEWGGEGRTFLSDVMGQGATVIHEGSAELSVEPAWSPIADLLVHPGPDGGTLLRNAATDAVTELVDVPWPARFDGSGAYIYSPAWGEVSPDKQDATGSTAIYDVASRAVLFSLPGQPLYPSLFVDYVPVGASSEEVVAALYRTRECDGTVIYAETRAVTCVEGATGPSVSPDGTRVALTRQTGETGLVEYPGGGAVSQPIYEVVVVEVATGTERIVARDAIGDPPPLRWSADSSMLLLRWPFHYGL